MSRVLKSKLRILPGAGIAIGPGKADLLDVRARYRAMEIRPAASIAEAMKAFSRLLSGRQAR